MIGLRLVGVDVCLTALFALAAARATQPAEPPCNQGASSIGPVYLDEQGNVRGDTTPHVEPALLSELERAARQAWLEHATHVHFGRCHGCGRVRDENGQPLLVARQPRRRAFHCLTCHEFGPQPLLIEGEPAP